MESNSRLQAGGIAWEKQSGKEDDSMDRLSNLPDAVIHHILSFLDTRSAVQTSVLSRQWRCAWKHLSVLDLRISDMSPPGFKRYVEKVLSLRYDLNLSKVIYSGYLEESDTELENGVLARVIGYALSHETQHLVIRLQLDEDPEEYPFADFLGFNSDNRSLKSLELTCFSFGDRFRWSGFLLLGKLDLVECTFFAHEEDVIDPFASLPCLKDLVLHTLFMSDDDDDDTRFRISGLQLVSLRLSYSYFYKMEIHAPNLKYFALEYKYADHLVEFTELTLPSLDHADIRVNSLDLEYEDIGGPEYTKQCMIPLFHGLRNATSLVLCHETAWMLEDIYDYLKDQHSPLTRLKSLVVGSRHSLMHVPSTVVDFFVKGFSDVKPVVKILS